MTINGTYSRTILFNGILIPSYLTILGDETLDGAKRK